MRRPMNGYVVVAVILTALLVLAVLGCVLLVYY